MKKTILLSFVAVSWFAGCSAESAGPDVGSEESAASAKAGRSLENVVKTKAASIVNALSAAGVNELKDIDTTYDPKCIGYSVRSKKYGVCLIRGFTKANRSAPSLFALTFRKPGTQGSEYSLRQLTGADIHGAADPAFDAYDYFTEDQGLEALTEAVNKTGAQFVELNPLGEFICQSADGAAVCVVTPTLVDESRSFWVTVAPGKSGPLVSAESVD